MKKLFTLGRSQKRTVLQIILFNPEINPEKLLKELNYLRKHGRKYVEREKNIA